MNFGKKKKDKKPNLIVESPKTSSKEEKLVETLLELSDSEIEALFEAGRITQDEFEYILDFRKKNKKSKNKSQKEQFEERIRCDNSVIEKVVNLGRRFRVEDLLAHGKFEEAKKADVNKEFSEEIEDQEMEIGARDKHKEERLRQKYLERTSRGRGRERDR